MTETRLQSILHRGLGSLPDVRLFRNSVGLGWCGQVVRHDGTSVILNNPRKVRFGLHPGSSDLIGWRTIEITPAMVGKRMAVFVGIEVKTDGGRIRPEQQQWDETLRKFGAVSVITRSPNPETVYAQMSNTLV